MREAQVRLFEEREELRLEEWLRENSRVTKSIWMVHSAVLADLGTTYSGIEHHGLTEANGLVAGVLDVGGWPLLLGVNGTIQYFLHKQKGPGPEVVALHADGYPGWCGR